MTPKENTMADQNTLADKVREIAAEMRAAMRRDDDTYRDAEFLDDLSGYISDLEALLPPLPTLADMTLEDRAACLRMQCDTGPNRSVRGFIAAIHTGGCYVVERDTWEWRSCSDDLVTPRPDLPRMEWPGTEKPAPVPALPHGWRLADHRDHGRVIVTNTTPNSGGHVYFTVPTDGNMGYGCHFCDPDELTYIDQEGDTSDTVPPNTLTKGSEWDDADALARACDESGRDQITVADKDGDVFVWGADAGWWETGLPGCDYAPHTIIHTGKKAHQ